MTGDELIASLQELTPEQRKLNVYVYADHGQITMKQSTLTIARVHKEDLDQHMIEDTVHDDDVDEDEEYGFVIEIGSP